MSSGATLDEIETPAAVIDTRLVAANARRAADYACAHGLAWRPHTKTHKSRAVARVELASGARGLTVATPREAEVMADVTDDVLLAYPPIGASKLGRIVDLAETTRLVVALDSDAALEELAQAAAARGRSVGVLIEMDVGMRRVGVPSPEDVRALAARAVELDGVDYRGVLFYPGHIRAARAEQDRGLAELSERIGRLLEVLGAADLAPATVSGGSTPTFWRSHEVQGVTEVRAGTLIFNDREQVSMGVATWADCAYSVLATVVSTAVPGQAVVDAGSKALTKEGRVGVVATFGALLDQPDVVVSGLSEEHGILDLAGTAWRPRIGERVRIVPNHVCVSANLQDALWAWDGERLERWEQEARGRGPWR
ncbi:MAG: D-TA family PLP-dependent enzyme [Gemmatimonadetes bacterium]|nr:D-TA family PLP-dependent enzyme [Gemmatimonadota bacterium]